MKLILALAVVCCVSMSPLVATTAASAATEGATVGVDELLSELSVADPLTTPYNRDLFAEGIDADGDGCNTRREVLRQESLVPVTIVAPCQITAGQWLSSYDNEAVTDPALLEMDHVVALKEAWISGAALWTDLQRSDYANDLGIADTLVMVTGGSNSAKGAKDPAGWLPQQRVQCDYVSQWITIKYRWQLTVDAAETAAIHSVLDGCPAITVQVPELGNNAVAQRPPVVQPDQTSVGGAVPFPAGTYRLGGSDRFSTAVQISARYTPNVDVVYISTGFNYPDALSAAAAAASLGGPLLLVAPTSIPDVVALELARLSPAEIVIVGGPAAVSSAVEDQLQSFGPVRRVSGVDRFETSRNIAQDAGASGTTAFLATGFNFPDALSASSAAASLNAPVILVNGATSIDAPTAALLSSLSISSVRIVGGTSAIGASFEQSLARILGRSNVTRLAGADRYSTGVAINGSAFSSPSTVFLAVGTNYADALAGGAYAGATASPLFVVQSTCVPTVVRNQILALAPSTIVLLGGQAALSPAIASLSECVTPPPAPSAPPPPVRPPHPGSSVNCSNFSTQAEAQRWFDRYYPYYGDVAGLDRDHDLIACESLR